VQPATGQILLLDAESGTQFDAFPAPGNLQPSHTNIGLTTADGGNALLYINSDDDPNTIYRLNPTTGQVLSTSTVTGENYDGLGFDGNIGTRTLYEANMDTRPNGTYQGLWNWGRPTGSGSFPLDPTSGRTGDNVVGYNLNGNYEVSLPSPRYFTLQAIDARGYDNLTLSFYRWLSLESCCDTATVEYSTNGTSWSELWRSPTDVETRDQSWVLQSFQLPAAANNSQTLSIRWGMGPTDSSVQYPGWNLDDIVVTGRTVADPQIFLSRNGVSLVRQNGYNGTIVSDWATSAPTGGVAGDDTSRAFAYFTDGFIHEFDPDTDTDGFVGTPITPPAGGVQGLAFDGSYLFASTADGGLHEIDAATGNVIASRSVPGGALYGLAAAARLAPPTQATIVPQGSVWKYFDRGMDLETAWLEPGYDDSTWASGPGRLGYSPGGQDGETTTVSFGPDPNNKYTTTYFRRHFNVADPSALAQLTLSVTRDDGIAVYLNGVEVARDNLAPGATYSTFANSVVSGTLETRFFDFQVNPSLLVAGDNVLAVEVHQSDLTSTDLGFDLRLIGTPAPRKTADVDAYSLDLTGRTGQPIDILLAGVGGSSMADASMQLVAPDGTTVLANGMSNPLGTPATGYALGVLGFVVPADGVYTVKVTSSAFGRYNLVVNESDRFESEPNDLPTRPLRDLGVGSTLGTPAGQGFVDVSAGGQDGYTVTLAAGQILRLSTERPLGDVLSQVNTLDPSLRLYDPNGVLVAANDDGSADGLNARIVYCATVAGVYRVLVGSEAGRGEYRLTASVTDALAPQVHEISIGSSQWPAAFSDHLATSGRGNAGFSIVHNTDAMREVLPWLNLDRIAVRFDRDIQIAGEHLRLRGDADNMPGITGFTYDAPTRTAVWTLAAPLPEGNYYVEVADDAQTAAGIRLDGDADGAAGGDLARRFGVLFGDANHSGSASVADVIDVRNRLGTTTADAAYSPRADFDASGTIDEADRIAIHLRLNRRLPVALPPAQVSEAGFDLEGDPEANEQILTGMIGVAGMGLATDLNHDGIVNQADLDLLSQDPPSPAAAPAAVVDRAVSAITHDRSPLVEQRATRTLRASRQPSAPPTSRLVVPSAIDQLLSTHSIRRR
jgi:hypothetical protein